MPLHNPLQYITSKLNTQSTYYSLINNLQNCRNVKCLLSDHILVSLICSLKSITHATVLAQFILPKTLDRTICFDSCCRNDHPPPMSFKTL
ncbi:hypothetical protein Hanom_Chr01g00074921 [Helianthus anomalus]